MHSIGVSVSMYQPNDVIPSNFNSNFDDGTGLTPKIGVSVVHLLCTFLAHTQQTSPL